MPPKFGPAGNSDSFREAGYKSNLQVPGWLRQMGLTAYEYQCGHGTRVPQATAEAFGKKAAEHGIAVSVHAPYYISLASAEEEKRLNSVRYIVESGRIVHWMGGSRIVVHPGGLGGRTREEATALAAQTLALAQRALDEEGLAAVRICPETMGKINQLGDLDEVLTLCGVDERFLPCVDFGHLNCRTGGGMNSAEAFAGAVDRIRNTLGEERARAFHIHFSKIEYSAGGEKKHLTFADDIFGPEPMPLMALIARRDLEPTVICESSGTQAEDALTMQQMWQQQKEAIQ
ncbi:MAG: TIM barrel protein [Acutalibacteraceae bacterium]|jgi:deoxyribonuclease-4